MILLTLYVIFFGILGVPIMTLTLISDCVYFWINNFRFKLKKIVIDNEPSTISNQWIKKLKLLADKYAFNRIKAVFTIQFVSTFREDIDLNSQL